MKSKKTLKVFLPALFLGLTVANFSYGFSLSKIYSPKIALGSESVICDCALLGGNNNCAANNYGADCAPTSDSMCADYNTNCEG
ncbi:hypothetical protein [Mucilaginibacter aquaedulcis]|uniref:hypothetical protein n=1 Tax=Mucilaginibacter aquaedulcis TaxID=1187081 RepID=UPI0025B570D2|nr:hypothetical protein [Mucilaginibacter aquaedulcis]MDN3548809.1 hypothetical protein [Mucilaginibacter aquaedulcis]